jgi:hypothetical protein
MIDEVIVRESRLLWHAHKNYIEFHVFIQRTMNNLSYARDSIPYLLYVFTIDLVLDVDSLQSTNSHIWRQTDAFWPSSTNFKRTHARTENKADIIY